VASYLVELYLSRAGSDGADGTAERARSTAEAMAREGLPIRWLRAIFVPEDETCFYLFEAGSAELVRAVGERAGISFDRVLEANESEVSPGSEDSGPDSPAQLHSRRRAVCMVSVMTGMEPAPSLGFMHALVVVYGLRGIDSAAHTELDDQLAPALDAVPGLVSRTRLENTASGRYGAFYLFESKAAFDRFVASELYGAAHCHAAVIGVAASDFAIPNGRGRTA
jgi:Protein of unknown function (DUF4242)/Putative mono-oxygenase ydhR